MPTGSGIDTTNDPFLTHTLPVPGSAQARSQQSLGGADPASIRRRFKFGGKTPKELMYDAGFYPLTAFTVIAFLFSFIYHLVPLLAWLAVLAYFGAVVLVAPPHVGKARGVDWLPLFALMVAICSAVVLGALNFELHMHPYFKYAFHTSYANVLPSEGAAAHADAGKIVWSASARVDNTRSVGYKEGYHTYCVAPVMDDSDMSKIGFWAAGIDCCNARGLFWCDEAGSPLAYGAVPLVEPGLLSLDHDGYYTAIKMAEASFNVHSEKNPLLIRWVTDPVMVEYKSLYMGVGLYILGFATSCIITVLIVTYINLSTN